MTGPHLPPHGTPTRRVSFASRALACTLGLAAQLGVLPATSDAAPPPEIPAQSEALPAPHGPTSWPTVDGMPANQWYMNTTDADGAKMTHFIAEYGVEAKPGNTIIVLHGGWGAEHSYLVPAIKPLADQYRFVLYDQRGSLRSPATPPAKITYANLIEDLEQLRQRLGLEKVTLMAHSMGNMLAYGYLREHPDRVAGLVLVGPVLPGHDSGTEEAPRLAPPCVSEAWPGFAMADALASAERSRQWSRDASDRWIRIAADEGLIPKDWAAHNPPDTDVERLQALYLKTDQQRTMGWRIIFTTVNTYSGRNWRETLGGMVFYNPRVAESIFAEPDYLDSVEAFWPALKAFKGPVRVIIGTHDYCDLGPTFWPKLATILPDARLETIQNAGHVIWIDEPAAFTAALRSALQQTVVQAPAPSEAAEPNPNLRDFDFVVEKLRLNYAGWETKVTDATRPKLDALTARLRAEAATAGPDRFSEILQEWLAFFNDRHIGAAPMSVVQPSQEDAAQAAASTPRLDLPEASVRERLTELGDRRDPLEGVWKINDRYRIGVLRTPGKEGSFSGVVLSTTAEGWSAGQVKVEFTRLQDGTIEMLFRAGDHSEHRQPVTLVADGCLLRSDRWGGWMREHPAPPASTMADMGDRLTPSGSMFLRPLSDRTMWLRLPDFDDSRAKPLADLLASEEARLSTFPNLLIDLRENGGGSDFVYRSLMPWIYTRPIYGIGVELRASADNLALRKRVADDLRTQEPEVAKELDEQNVRMQRNLGGYITNGLKSFDIERMDQIRPFPRRVAILIDGAGSSGEQFLLEARQSRKVTLFGHRNSAGVLDFANVVAMDTPSGRHRMFWATSRSLRLPEDPVDPDGIAPDIRIPQDVIDPVGFAQAWLERQVD